MIAVLPAEVTAEQLDAIRRTLEERGWTSVVSRGEEQTILTVKGPLHEADLALALDGQVEADVISIGDAAYYRSQGRNRRRMHGLVVGLSLLLLSGLGIPVLGYLRAPDAVFAAYDFVPVTTLEKLEENSAQIVRVHGRVTLLVHLSGQRLFALSGVCTYMEECQLEWSAERGQILCPCHGGVYDIYGNVVSGPPSKPLASFEVDVLGTDVRVRRGA